MGTYRANRNNDIVDEEKSEKEQKKDSTAKALDVGLETGLDVYTAGAFSKVKNAVTSVPIAGKLSQKKWDKSINKAAGVLSKTPVGDIAKQVDDVGVTDAARGVKDAYNMASGAGGSINNSTSNSSNKGNILNSLSKLKGKSSSKKSSLLGDGTFKVSNLFSFKMKLIIVGCFVGFLFFIMLFMTVFAEPDDVNMGLTNNTELSSKGGTVTEEDVASKLVYLNDSDLGVIELNKDSIYAISVKSDNIDDNINTIKNIMGEYNYYIIPNGDNDIDTKLKNEFGDKVLDSNESPLDEIYQKIIISGANINSSDMSKKLEELALYYINNVKSYNQGKTYSIPFINNESFRADCTGFAVAYMSYVSGKVLPKYGSSAMTDRNGNFAVTAKSSGWNIYTSDEIGELQFGDVLVANSSIPYSVGNHAEIYVDSNHTFGWGSAKKNYPVSNSISKEIRSGHTVFSDSYKKGAHKYVTVYRYGNINS